MVTKDCTGNASGKSNLVSGDRGKNALGRKEVRTKIVGRGLRPSDKGVLSKWLTVARGGSGIGFMSRETRRAGGKILPPSRTKGYQLALPGLLCLSTKKEKGPVRRGGEQKKINFSSNVRRKKTAMRIGKDKEGVRN